MEQSLSLLSLIEKERVIAEDHCCNGDGFCKYYVPKQFPFGNPNAGLCEHPSIPEKTEFHWIMDKHGIKYFRIIRMKNGKERKQKLQCTERPDYIPNLKKCPGRVCIKWCGHE